MMQYTSLGVTLTFDAEVFFPSLISTYPGVFRLQSPVEFWIPPLRLKTLDLNIFAKFCAGKTGEIREFPRTYSAPFQVVDRFINLSRFPGINIALFVTIYNPLPIPVRIFQGEYVAELHVIENY